MDHVEEIREIILKNKKPCYQTTNRKELRVRCPYCGDSRKDASAAHLYIEMAAPFRFHCFKCETSGVLNNQTLRDLEIFDSNLTLSITGANREYRNNQGLQKLSLSKKVNVKNYVYDSELTNRTTNYFNNRFGTLLPSNYIKEKFNVVLDPTAFLQENNIYVPKGHFDFLNGIGFVSSDNSHIVFRDISGLQKRRYYNLAISLDEDAASKIYTIKNNIDVMSEKINLVITEGIFDIIGVYLHYYKDTDKEKNTIFSAACGKGFNAVISNFVREGFLDMDITIYSDGDVDLDFYRNLKKTSDYLRNNRIVVYYNSLYNKQTGFGKDFGVPKDQIQLRKVVI